MIKYLVHLAFVLIAAPLFSHEGHHDQLLHHWMQNIGSLHFLFLHFPIALITMTAICELLQIWKPRQIFDNAARFMLIAAAILSIPTTIFGLLYRYSAPYSGLLENLVWWHMWFGISTTILASIVIYFREYDGKVKSYYISLILLFLLVTITGFLGGSITFG